MDKAIYTIKTKMEKEDYRKFLYIATFRRNYKILLIIATMSLAGAFLTAWSNGFFTIVSILILWILLFCLSIGVICLKVELKNKRISTDKTGTIGGVNILKFYSDCLTMETSTSRKVNTLGYNKFYRLLESKDYFIFYFSVNRASLLRKRDISNLEEFQTFIRSKLTGKYKKI